jgi:ATP-binding cassette subfamily B protein
MTDAQPGADSHGGTRAPRSRRVVRGAWSAVRLAARACPWWLTGNALATLASALLPVATVWLLKHSLDALTTGAASAAFPPAAFALVVVGLLAATLPSLTEYVQNEVGRAIGRRAQSDLYVATARLAGLARLEDPAFHDRLRMAQSAGRSSPGQVVGGVIGTGQLAVTLCGLAAVLAVINPVIAVVTLLGLAPALVAEIRLSRERAGMLWAITPNERREFFYAELQTSIPAAKELRLLGLSELFRLRMLRELAVADTQRRRLDGHQLRAQLGLGLVSAVVLGVALIWAFRAAARGTLTVGDVSALIAAIAALQSTLASLVARLSLVYHSLLMYDHYLAVLEAEPDLPLAAHPEPARPLCRAIEFRDVWFRYAPDQDWVLRGVNLVIPHGTAVALVGLNGAGKSTLVKLLCRFYDPERGAVLWDGVDLRDLSVTGLRERIGALFQDYMRYELTAAENVGLGDLWSLDDDEKIRAASVRAGIHAAIQALPRGYQTMLSRTFVPRLEDGQDAGTGVLLSGGQWQRLSLARTFLRDRRDLLILDEPSSGLDAEAEYAIHHGLRAHRAGATSLLISHRLGAVRDADRIVVLGGGRIVEEGSHRELLAADGEYARLFRLQADGYRGETDDDPVAASI